MEMHRHSLSSILASGCAALLSALLVAGCGQSGQCPRSVEDFNFGWRFCLGDESAYAAEDFDDSAWRELHLPHDWSIEGEFSVFNPSTPGGGALPGGIGWYRKSFPTPQCVGKGGRVFVEFDGVFMNSTVFVNGEPLGTRPYGYSSFTYDITEKLHTRDSVACVQNTIAVRCDNADQPNSRWYAGCGIYRDVRLVCVASTHVAYNGMFVSAPEVHEDKARVHIEASVEGGRADGVEFCIRDAKGRKVASAQAQAGQGEGLWSADITLKNPRRWDISDTYLYSATALVNNKGILCDSYTVRFGVRTLAWDADKGFSLNGRPLKLLGVCLHHDMGCLGTAVHRRALERELQILKRMGVNAVRTSHNPPAPVLLDLCDEMGFVVMDEAMDMWRKRKTRYDYARFFDEWHVTDVQDFVRRDRNHPCIIMWSVGNEILEQSDSREDKLENLSAEEANLLMNFIHTLGGSNDSSENNPNILLTKHMAQLVRDLDTSRAVTAGCNSVSPQNNLLRSGALDVYGLNYHPDLYDSCRVWFPGKPLLGSETVSSLNSRGIYFQPSTNKEKQPLKWWMTYDSPHHQCTSYDALCAPWANYHEEAWTAVRDRDFIAGTFIWTGFDYLGEPTPYSWPSRSSYFGIVDLAGFPKDSYYFYQGEWTEQTVLHLFPHWNWKQGDSVDVWAYYNNADEVELLLNGKSLGRKSKTRDFLHAEWLKVPFEPGKIEAVSYKDGAEVAREARLTPGEPASLKLTADRSVISADGYDLSYVTIEAVDELGRRVDTATDMLQISVEGAGELAGVDNGNAASGYCLKGDLIPLFSGKALAVVRSIKDVEGTATLNVSSSYARVKLNIMSK